jgi:hypothetical protein
LIEAAPLRQYTPEISECSNSPCERSSNRQPAEFVFPTLQDDFGRSRQGKARSVISGALAGTVVTSYSVSTTGRGLGKETTKQKQTLADNENGTTKRWRILMAFASIDGNALKLAEQAGFHPFSDVTVDSEWPLCRFSCVAIPSCTDPSEILARAIEAADRWAPKMTVWLDVQAQEFPNYVQDALDKVGHYPAAVVVTHAGKCSHGPNAELTAPELQAALIRCGRGGGKWHPLLRRVVISGSQAEPQTAR